nr:putative mitochondrial protein [Tanacetum cinerariifolium]
CSKHMTSNRALLMNFVEKLLGTVRFGNNDFAVIAGYGDVVIALAGESLRMNVGLDRGIKTSSTGRESIGESVTEMRAGNSGLARESAGSNRKEGVHVAAELLFQKRCCPTSPKKGAAFFPPKMPVPPSGPNKQHNYVPERSFIPVTVVYGSKRLGNPLDYVDDLVQVQHEDFTLALINNLFSKGLRTVKSIPPKCRLGFSRVLKEALDKVICTPDDISCWVSLLFLPLCLLKTFRLRSNLECELAIKRQRQEESIVNVIRS